MQGATCSNLIFGRSGQKNAIFYHVIGTGIDDEREVCTSCIRQKIRPEIAFPQARSLFYGLKGMFKGLFRGSYPVSEAFLRAFKGSYPF